MAPSADIDLDAPFERDTILEVRSSKMKTMPGLKIQSGIDKTIREGSVPVTFMGIEGDEHDPTFHGGVDKAVHGYCASHYPKWQSEYPEAASRFRPGGFGENLVTTHMNERNVCIGDIVSIGGPSGVLLQVSLPRQPCFKLNHRFQLKNFAPKTYALSRTGWYYRVLREGPIAAGMEIALVERKHPAWTIERVQEYLHRNLDDAAMNEELAAIEDMGEESRGSFRSRVAKQKAREKKRAAAAANGSEGEEEEGEEKKELWKPYRIVSKRPETARVMCLALEAVSPDPENPKLTLGAHVRLRLPNGLLRSYSIVSGSGNNSFNLGIALASPSRGGSHYLHNVAKEGDTIQVGRITSDIKPAGLASDHIFIVGGIGITAFLAMLPLYEKAHWNSTLHFAVRSRTDIPFREVVEGLGGSVAVRIYDASKGERMDIPGIFSGLGFNSHVYVCGPGRMLEAAARQAKARGLGEDEVHLEAFAADTTGDPFEVEVANRGGKILQVSGEETLLEVLREHFEDVPSSCEVGNCGTCRITLKRGQVDHRGTALMDDEKGEAMLSCVSRGIERIVIEI